MVRDCNMLKQDLYNELFLTKEAVKRAGSKANDSLVSLIVVDCSTSVCKVRTKLQQIVAWVFERILGGSGLCYIHLQLDGAVACCIFTEGCHAHVIDIVVFPATCGVAPGTLLEPG